MYFIFSHTGTNGAEEKPQPGQVDRSPSPVRPKPKPKSVRPPSHRVLIVFLLDDCRIRVFARRQQRLRSLQISLQCPAEVDPQLLHKVTLFAVLLPVKPKLE